MHARDEGFVERAHLQYRRVDDFAHTRRDVEARQFVRANRREVEAGAEGFASARDDDDAARVRGRLAYGFGEGVEHLEVNGVAARGIVECDALDAVVECDEELFVFVHAG